MAKIRTLQHYIVRKGRAYWFPTAKMKAAGFRCVPCGVDGPEAVKIAAEWEARWQAARTGAKPHVRKIYPRGTIGDAYERYRQSSTWAEKATRTREDWDRGWDYIEPIFGDQRPSVVTFEHIDKWYARILKQKGAGEAGRAMKIWRAHYNVMVGMKLCPRGSDPSQAIRKKSVAGRTQTWSYGEAVRLVKGAWRAGYHGLACIVAIAWDTGFAPVDARTLTLGHTRGDGTEWWFYTERGKTGEPAIGTLSKKTRRLVHAYVDGLDYELADTAPIFRTRGYAPAGNGGRPRASVPYTKDSLIDDFADVRRLVFGKDEKRRLMDMRRSGAVESLAGGASAEAMSTKLANSMDQNKALWRTYLPVDKATIRSVDDARLIGRRKLRLEQTADKKLKLGKEKS